MSNISVTTNTTNTTNNKTLINQIIYLLNELTIDYQNSQKEQQQIGSELSLDDEEFSFLEELEILTVNLRGYASQIKEIGCIQNAETARQSLQQMRIFEIPIIVNFYFEHSANYPQIKNYLQKLDYLRLLLLNIV